MLSPGEMMELFNISASTLRRYLDLGILPRPYLVGTLRRWCPKEVREAIAKQPERLDGRATHPPVTGPFEDPGMRCGQQSAQRLHTPSSSARFGGSGGGVDQDAPAKAQGVDSVATFCVEATQ